MDTKTSHEAFDYTNTRHYDFDQEGPSIISGHQDVLIETVRVGVPNILKLVDPKTDKEVPVNESTCPRLSQEAEITLVPRNPAIRSKDQYQVLDVPCEESANDNCCLKEGSRCGLHGMRAQVLIDPRRLGGLLRGLGVGSPFKQGVALDVTPFKGR